MAFNDNLVNETHRMAFDTARRFALKEIQPHAHEWEEAGTFPRNLYEKAADAGIIGVGFPESLGGSGGGALETVMVVEGMMRGESTGVSVSLGSLGIALPPLVAAQTPYLQEAFIRPALAGAKIAALAITEPDTGSDVSGISTRAKKTADGWVVRGAKTYITSGVRADFYTTLVRTGEDPHAGLTFLVIDRHSDGVYVSAPLRKTGWWASDTAEIRFDDVEVPATNIVGVQGGGFFALMRSFQMERLALAAYGVATAEMALEATLEWVRERKAFGRPLVGFQVTRHKLVDMATQLEAVRTFVYQVAHRMDLGDDVVKEVSMAKNLAATLAVEVTYEAVQLHGGMGYMRESLVERLSRDARLLPIGGGSQEIMKEIIAKMMAL